MKLVKILKLVKCDKCGITEQINPSTGYAVGWACFEFQDSHFNAINGDYCYTCKELIKNFVEKESSELLDKLNRFIE